MHPNAKLQIFGTTLGLRYFTKIWTNVNTSEPMLATKNTRSFACGTRTDVLRMLNHTKAYKMRMSILILHRVPQE